MPWFPKQKVVVPVDFSDKSFTAVSTALDLVDDPAVSVHQHRCLEWGWLALVNPSSRAGDGCCG